MSQIQDHIEKLIETHDRIQLNVPYLKFIGRVGDDYKYHNCIEKAIEFYGKPIDIIPGVAYFDVEASEFYEVIDKGCPCCGKDTFKFIGWPPAEFIDNPDYAVLPGAYDVVGVMPRMGCRNCYLYIGVNESWFHKDSAFKYHIKDSVRLNNDMEASITEILDDNRFVAAIDYPDGEKTESITLEDIKYILRRYE